jgi:hypothetical protein
LEVLEKSISKEAAEVIVKQAELVLVNPFGGCWYGDLPVSKVEDHLYGDEYLKIKHQLVCDECNRGVRAQDEHRCDEPD